ncbi:MAG: DegT/DnrJ/EryC1/StrS family aminotransferase [Planctomycetota bacterium]|nr:MAG: DegT/DnrJ/EryC1/StrS family aminotransferase [Planctomycetota bacterium]
MKVPLLDLAAQFRTVEAELREAIDRVLVSQQYVLGPEAQALEAEIAEFCGAKHAVGVSNGSDAIVAALMALNIGPGDEVIVPAFTFYATAGSVERVGAKPVFVDILADTFNIDPDAIPDAVSDKTRAIIPVHLYGQCAEMDRIMAVADRHKLAVIEDAAQAIGAEYNGKGAGNFGNAGTLSFYPTKNLSAIGEAGMVLTNDAKLADELRCVRLQGQTSSYEHARLGANFRIDGIQAAALRVKLSWLNQWNENRRKHAARYNEGLQNSVVITPPVNEACKHIYHQYTIRSPKRDKLRAHLNDAGIGSGVYYPIPLHLQPAFIGLGYKRGSMPVAEQASEEVLSLPVFPEMTAEQQDYVIETINQFK